MASSLVSKFHREPYPSIDPTASHNSQAGRHVLITGSTGGIGFATAKAYLKARVSTLIVTGRKEEGVEKAIKELETLKSGDSKIIGKVCDISKHEAVDALWKYLEDEKLEVHTMVLNAATMGSTTPEGNVPSLVGMWSMFEVNVLSSLRMTDKFLAQGPKLGKVLINISTSRAHNSPQRSNEGYGPSKVAITRCFEALADHTSADALQIINIMPGIIATESVQKAGIIVDDTIAWMFDDINLPACSIVWASLPQAGFLHGRFIWSHWDVDELAKMKPQLEQDAGLWRIGLNGIEDTPFGNPIKHLAFLKEMGHPKSAD